MAKKNSKSIAVALWQKQNELEYVQVMFFIVFNYEYLPVYRIWLNPIFLTP